MVLSMCLREDTLREAQLNFSAGVCPRVGSRARSSVGQECSLPTGVKHTEFDKNDVIGHTNTAGHREGSEIGSKLR